MRKSDRKGTHPLQMLRNAIPEWASYLIILIITPLMAHATALLWFAGMRIAHGPDWDSHWSPHAATLMAGTWLLLVVGLVYVCTVENRWKKTLFALLWCVVLIVISLFGFIGLVGQN